MWRQGLGCSAGYVSKAVLLCLCMKFNIYIYVYIYIYIRVYIYIESNLVCAIFAIICKCSSDKSNPESKRCWACLCFAALLLSHQASGEQRLCWSMWVVNTPFAGVFVAWALKMELGDLCNSLVISGFSRWKVWCRNQMEPVSPDLSWSISR